MIGNLTFSRNLLTRGLPYQLHRSASLPEKKEGRVDRNEGALTSSSPLGEVAWTENSSDGKWQEDGRFVSAFTSKPNGLLFAIAVEMEVGMKFDGICPK